MYYFFAIIIFIFGLIIGSFLNALIYRLKTKKSVWQGRSFCPNCKKKLETWDLIPVFSFIFLRGRCRYCHKKISWQYPAVELATGLIFVLIFYYQYLIPKTYNLTTIISFIFYLFIASILIIVFVYDLKHYIIPDKIIWTGISINLIYWLVGVSFYFMGDQKVFYQLFPGAYSLTPNPLYIILGGLISGGFFLILVLVSRGKWMGGGDVKLAFFMGLFLGFPQVLVALFISFVVGSIVSIILVAWHKKTFKSQIPFGPFLVLGSFAALFWGVSIINWYLSFLLR